MIKFFSLDYFGNRRTDTNVSSKFQGVETASQIRYVTYYEKMKKMNIQYPIDVSVAIKYIQISGEKSS
jgi:PTEN phosphatase family protein